MATALTLSDAVLVRVTDDASPARYAVYDASVPDSPAQAYAVVYPSAGAALNERYGQAPRLLRWSCYVICVGRNRRQIVNTAELVRSRLTGWRISTNAVLSESPINAQINVENTNPGDIRYSLTLLFTTTTTRG